MKIANFDSGPLENQMSKIKCYLEHLYAPGVHIEQFDPMADDVIEKIREMVVDCKTNGSNSRGHQMAKNTLETSRPYTDHMGIVEAFAYSLLTYKNFTAFEVNTSVEGFREVKTECCRFTNLPPRFAAAVSGHLAT